MAFNGAKVAAATLKRMGQAVTINWPHQAFNAAGVEPQVSTYAYISTKSRIITPASFKDGVKASAYVAELRAMLPVQPRDLVGATITTDSQTYQVVSVVEQNGAYVDVVLS